MANSEVVLVLWYGVTTSSKQKKGQYCVSDDQRNEEDQYSVVWHDGNRIRRGSQWRKGGIN